MEAGSCQAELLGEVWLIEACGGLPQSLVACHVPDEDGCLLCPLLHVAGMCSSSGAAAAGICTNMTVCARDTAIVSAGCAAHHWRAFAKDVSCSGTCVLRMSYIISWMLLPFDCLRSSVLLIVRYHVARKASKRSWLFVAMRWSYTLALSTTGTR